jgi:hypothetical protein
MNDAPHANVASLDRINLRLSADTFDAIDFARASRPGRVSRNTWIAEAIEEKLALEAAAPTKRLRKAGNA